MIRAIRLRPLPPTLPDIIMFVYSIAGQVLGPFVPLYARSLGMSNQTIGLVLAVPGLAALLVSLAASVWLARAGARRLLLGSSAVAASALVAVWAFGTAPAFMVFMPLFWAVQPLIAVATQVLVVSQTGPAGRDRTVGTHAVYVSMGVPIGPLLGSAVVHASGTLAAIFPVAAAAAAAAIVLTFWVPNIGRLDVVHGVPLLARFRDVPRDARQAILAIVVAEFCYVAWATFFPLALGSAGLTPAAIGLVFSLYGVTMPIVRATMAALAARLGRVGVLALAFVSIAIGLWLSLFPRVPWLVNMTAVSLGVGFGLVFPITIVLVSVAAPADQLGRLLSIRFLGITVGQMLGPSLAGSIAGIGMAAPLAATAGVASVAAIWILRVALPARRLPAPASPRPLP